MKLLEKRTTFDFLSLLIGFDPPSSSYLLQPLHDHAVHEPKGEKLANQLSTCSLYSYMRHLFWLLLLGKYRRGLGCYSSPITLAIPPIPFESKHARTAVISRKVGARSVVMANMNSFFTLVNICKRFGQSKTF